MDQIYCSHSLMTEIFLPSSFVKTPPYFPSDLIRNCVAISKTYYVIWILQFFLGGRRENVHQLMCPRPGCMFCDGIRPAIFDFLCVTLDLCYRMNTIFMWHAAHGYFLTRLPIVDINGWEISTNSIDNFTLKMKGILFFAVSPLWFIISNSKKNGIQSNLLTFASYCQ